MVLKTQSTVTNSASKSAPRVEKKCAAFRAWLTNMAQGPATGLSEQLEAALLRIQNKTYGICRRTGKLIPAERLRAVPHTTMSMEAKLKQN